MIAVLHLNLIVVINYLMHFLKRNSPFIVIAFISSQAFSEEATSSKELAKYELSASCPSLFQYEFCQGEETTDTEAVVFSVYMDCKNLNWTDSKPDPECAIGYQCCEATCLTQNNNHCGLSIISDEYTDVTSLEVDCSPSSCNHSQVQQYNPDTSCVPYIVDKNCHASFDYFKIANIKWLACHNNSAMGTFTNLKKFSTCKVALTYNSTHFSTHGNAYCPDCDNINGASIAWRSGGFDRTDNSMVGQGATPGFIDILTDTSCIELVNDGTCSIPHFRPIELIWGWCVREHGHGVFSNNFNDKTQVCVVRLATEFPFPCANKGRNCGVIFCAENEGASTPLCQGSWNMPGKPEFYDLPAGCLGGSSPFPDSNNNLIFPLSLTGSVVFTAVISVAAIAAICLCYSKYKRQGYQSVP